MTALDVTLWSIPSPSQGVWYLGPVPLRGYALAIILGIVAAIWIGERRWVARGGRAGDVPDLAIWAVPFGLVGGRLYHVATDCAALLRRRTATRSRRSTSGAAGSASGARSRSARSASWSAPRSRASGCCRCSTRMAPGVLVAQAIGRWGNWFNQELFGRPTDLPWALEIDADHRPDRATLDVATFHPTFLYEFLWNLAGFAFVVWADRRFRLGHGRVVALYVMVYTLGRGWIEMLRIDDVQLTDVLGLRLNVWTSIVLFVLAAAYFVGLRAAPPGPRGVGRAHRPTGASDHGARDDPEPSAAE